MKNSKFLLILFVIFTTGNLLAQSGFSILNQSKNSMTIRYYQKNVTFDTILTVNNLSTLLPRLENSQILSSQFGEPSTFIASTKLTVPNENGFKLKNFRVISSQRVKALITPIPELIKNEELPSKIYKINNDKYSNALNNNIVNLSYQGIARDKYIASLDVVSAYYDNINHEIVIPQDVIIDIVFNNDFSNNDKNSDKYNSDFNFTLNESSSHAWSINTSKDKLLYNENNKISELSNGTWVKIAVNEQGVYKIDASSLTNLGFNPKSDQVKTIKMFGNGGAQLSEKVSDALNNNLNEQQILVNTNQNGDLESIIFYGASTTGFHEEKNAIVHYKNEYSNTNYYLLTFGGRDGLRASFIESPSEQTDNKPTTYVNRILQEEELTNPYTVGAGRQWFGTSYFANPFINLLPNLDRSGKILYRVAVAQRADTYSGFDVFESENKLGSLSLGKTGSYTDATWQEAYFSLSAENIAQDNRSKLKLNYLNSAKAGSIGFLDFYEIHYPRSLVPINNELEFISDSTQKGINEYHINEFSGNIFGFDITQINNPKFIKNDATTGGMFIFKTNTKNENKRFYFSSTLKSPKLEKITLKNLRENYSNTKVLLITHPSLIESAENYKKYRESTSELKVTVVTTNDIFNEFGSGIPDVTAIRDYVTFCLTNWGTKPEYLILWGDGHYDFRNIATPKINHVPAYQTEDFGIDYYDETDNSYSTDDFYARLIGDDNLIDIKIGRLPVDSPEMGNWMLEKIKHYEQNSSTDNWRTNTILVADDGPASYSNQANDGASHTNQSEILTDYINKDIQQSKIYLVEYPGVNVAGGIRKPSVSQALISKINTTSGVILNWFGHGNPRVWAHEQILEREVTIPQFRNLDKLFFLTAATCDFARFDDPDVKSGTEELILSKNGGAIGAIGASRVVYQDANGRYAYRVYQYLMEKDENGDYPRLGDVLYKVKQTLYAVNDQKYILFADPTMRLNIPNYVIKIDSINGISTNNLDSSIQLKALSEVNIKASVYDKNGNKKVEGFNGTAYLTMCDGDQLFKIVEVAPWNPDSKNLFVFTKNGLVLNNSTTKVVNGSIETRFIIPKDISFSDSTGKLFIYATSDDKNFAKGSFNDFYIKGIKDITSVDSRGPDINIYLDGRDFVRGSKVSREPLLIVDLFDENGINSTGLGIGHRIEGWIDNSIESVDFTSKYSSSLSDSRFGTVEDILFNLKPGLHTIKFRAWDVFNNFSIKETSFIIPDTTESPMIWDLLNFPNPMRNSTTITFKHNLTPPFDFICNIYSINGVLIRNIKSNSVDFQNCSLEWDGFDNTNNRVAQGNYLFQITANTKYGVNSSKFGILSVVE